MANGDGENPLQAIIGNIDTKLTDIGNTIGDADEAIGGANDVLGFFSDKNSFLAAVGRELLASDIFERILREIVPEIVRSTLRELGFISYEPNDADTSQAANSGSAQFGSNQPVSYISGGTQSNPTMGGFGDREGGTAGNGANGSAETDPLALLKTQLETLQGEVDTIDKDKLVAVKTDLDTTTTRVGTAEGELGKLQTEVFSLNTDMGKLRGLPSLIQGLQAQINALKPNYGADDPDFQTDDRRYA